MDDLVEEFLVETSDSLNELDVDIVNLEQNPNDSELIGKIFRLVHTIKGTCGFLSLPRLEKVAHHSENVLGRFRDKDLEVTPEYVTLILNAFDRIKEIVSVIEETGSEPDEDDAELIARLDVVFELGKEGQTEDVIDDDIFPVMVTQDDEEDEPQETEKASEDVFEPIPVEGADLKTTETEPEPEEVTEGRAMAPVEEAKVDESAKKVQKPVTQSLRVNVQVLEDLMTMVSELVLTRNQLLQLSRTQQNTDLAAPLQNLNQVVSELQEGVMKTRMQPIGNAWQKLPRIVRDLSVDLGKKINFEMQGEETELDRQVLEMIKDPLTHMVRNSGDHGVEMPEERLAAGKPEEGHILLNAFHEGGHIIIEISDDGKGLPLDRIKQKAIDNDIYTAEELDEMPDQQIQQLIFHAGFSTAEKVTSVSGRGVGMDVVRTNIEKIGGAVELSSKEGKGSTFRIKIPLTLAIVSALLIEVAGEKFALPQINVQELVRISNETVHSIETIKDTPVLRLRDSLLPLVSLQDLLKLEDVEAVEEELEKVLSEESADKESDNVIEITKEEPKAEMEDSSNCYVIVLHVGSHTFGIMVDKVFDTEEIVVKPVSEILKDIPLYSGNTILGDGSVIMILDPNGIATAVGDASLSDKDAGDYHDEDEKRDQEKMMSLLAFSAGNGAPLAVPLSLISRLEEIKVGDIELSGGQLVVQYRDKLMPLIPFDENFKMKEEGRQAVLVFSDRDRSMGLLVDNIVDIVETDVDIQLEGDENGLLGSAIVNDQAMDIIDVGYYMSLAYADWFNVEVQTSFGHDGSLEKRILLVDDSSFFRNMLTPILSVSGYQVVAVDNPFEALELCSSGKIFDMIISDIEMPEMDGFEFAEKIKDNDSAWKDTPLVALSSHAAPEDFERGQDAGFNEYITKFDRDSLLKSIEETLSKKENVA